MSEQANLFPTVASAGKYLASWANFDALKRYRYTLGRVWDYTKPQLLWCGVNPSMAGGSSDDPTVRTMVGFAKKWGFGGFELVNLYALISTDPDGLLTAADPVGPVNDFEIIAAARRAASIVACWGAHKMVERRAEQVLDLFACLKPVHCIGVTKDKAPRHPLRTAHTTAPVMFRMESMVVKDRDVPPELAAMFEDRHHCAVCRHAHLQVDASQRCAVCTYRTAREVVDG